MSTLYLVAARKTLPSALQRVQSGTENRVSWVLVTDSRPTSSRLPPPVLVVIRPPVSMSMRTAISASGTPPW